MWCHHVLSSETKKRTRLSNLFPAVTYVPANYIHQHSKCFKPYFIIPIGLFFLFWLVDWHFPQVVSSLCISLSVLSLPCPPWPLRLLIDVVPGKVGLLATTILLFPPPPSPPRGNESFYSLWSSGCYSEGTYPPGSKRCKERQRFLHRHFYYYWWDNIPNRNGPSFPLLPSVPGGDGDEVWRPIRIRPPPLVRIVEFYLMVDDISLPIDDKWFP